MPSSRILLGVVSVFLSASIEAAPSLTLISPTPNDGWVIASSKAPLSDSVEVAFKVTEAGSVGSGLLAGILSGNSCQSLALPVSLPTGLVRGNGVSQYDVLRPNTPVNPTNDPVIQVKLPIAVSKAAKSPVLELCAFNPSNNGLTVLPLRFSNGDPVRNVQIQQANYFSNRQMLAIKGVVNPSGKNQLAGSTVVIRDGMGNELGKCLVMGKGFDSELPLKMNPGQVTATVVGKASKPKPVKSK